jgi:hypoxanthine phosphoribosyltransferase
MICTGSSGAIITGIISEMILQNSTLIPKILHVKKDGEYAHHNYSAIYPMVGRMFVYIDDFIETGESMKRIHEYCIRSVENFIPDAIIASGLINIDRLPVLPKFIISNHYQ